MIESSGIMFARRNIVTHVVAVDFEELYPSLGFIVEDVPLLYTCVSQNLAAGYVSAPTASYSDFSFVG